MNPKKTLKDLKLDPDHPRPVTRRDFISHGLMSGFAVSMMPSLLFSILKTDQARAAVASCPTSGSTLPPFLVIDCAGGLGLSGNFVVGGAGGSGDYLPSYATLGVSSEFNPRNFAPNVEFGAPFHANKSRILKGLLATVPVEARANTKMAILCLSLMDDTGRNKTSPLILAAEAGLRGSVYPQGLGMRSSNSGGNSDVPYGIPSLKPVPIANNSALLNAVKMGDGLTGMGDDRLKKIARAASNLTGLQKTKFESMTLGDQFSTLVECGYLKNIDTVEAASKLDASTKTEVMSVYTGKNAQGVVTEHQSANAAAVYNTLMGHVGPSAIVIGGCDYHNQGLEVSGNKDEEVGSQIGKAVQLAHLLKKPLCICVISDGAVAYNPEGAPIADSGSRSLAAVIFYDPLVKPNLVQRQIGHYTPGEIAFRNNFFATNASMAATIMAANYLNFAKRLDLLDKILPTGVQKQLFLDTLMLARSA